MELYIYMVIIENIKQILPELPIFPEYFQIFFFMNMFCNITNSQKQCKYMSPHIFQLIKENTLLVSVKLFVWLVIQYVYKYFSTTNSCQNVKQHTLLNTYHIL